jgi:hypothetical protein
MDKLSRPKSERLNLWIRIYFAVSFVTLIWTVSSIVLMYLNPPSSDWNIGSVATVLFGAASVALFAFSIFVGALAVVGWQAIERTIERAVGDSFASSIELIEDATNKVGVDTNTKLSSLEQDLRQKIELLESELRLKIQLLENESRGRVFSGLGYMLGEMGIGSDSMNPQNKEKIADAVELCRKGYELLEKVGDAAKFMGLNNLVFYSSVYEDIEGADRELILAKASELIEAGRAHNASNLLLTACRAILQYGSDPKDIQEARAILTYLVEAPGSLKQKQEAKLYLASFPEKLEEVT